MKGKSLEDMATIFLRNHGFTWAGNDTTAPEFETVVGNRKMDKERKIAGGMSLKKGGRISPKRRGGGVIY